MSKITGVYDFRDLLDKYGIEFMKKMNIYIGYANYLSNTTVDTSQLNEYEDWAFLFHYTIYAKSIYEKLGTGHIILFERDYFSMQDDAVASTGGSKKITKMRRKFSEELVQMGYSSEDVEKTARYRFELEGRIPDVVPDER